MLINRDQRGWMAATLVASAAACGLYWYSARAALYGPSGGSPSGLAFGILGTSLMVLAALFSLRKRFRTWRLGSARTWMNIHIWGGSLSVLLIVLHSGFSLGGPLTTILMVLFLIVTVSGLVGLALQQIVPRMMLEQLPAETVATQIDHVRRGLAVDAYEIVANVTGPLAEAVEERAWLEQEKKAGWKAPARRDTAATAAPGSEEFRAVYLEQIRLYLHRARGQRLQAPDLLALTIDMSADFAPRIEQLRAICEESRQTDEQLRLHALLHNWLYLHAPLSIMLLVLVAFHIWFALRY
ncbi:MAG TPA: ferric reductase-like transmembrane domain-containing protein [Candidatus Binatia bacterium]|jgi:hypothetical protein